MVPQSHLRLVDSTHNSDPANVSGSAVTIDCESCVARLTEVCDDCVVSYLVDHEPGMPVILDAEEERAIELLADAGLVPPSRFRSQSGVG